MKNNRYIIFENTNCKRNFKLFLKYTRSTLERFYHKKTTTKKKQKQMYHFVSFRESNILTCID